MVSINTNLSSLIVQNNLTKSTKILNQAIERMTTGFKLNHASDNAANYSIGNNMNSKISSYNVAADNIAMGMDMVQTAQDTISLLQSHAERIHNLITQAQNGTYGEDSLAAINAEVQARIAEIDRIYANCEYNGINLLQGVQLPDWTKEVKSLAGLSSDLSAQYNGFIAEAHTIDDATVNAMTHVAGLSNFNGDTTFAVSTKEDLANLATLVNSGVDTTGKTFIMGGDIDLSGVDWNPIGDNSTNSSATRFRGTFDGNGHKITGVTINKEGVNMQGLFGVTASGSTIENVGVEGVNIKGKNYTGGLVGGALGTVTNCYVTGSVSGAGKYTGGLVGYSTAAITNCYSTGSVSGVGEQTGGLAGYATGAVTNCYVTGSVNGAGNQTGGLAGYATGAVTNCYSTGSVNGTTQTGGLVGRASGTVTNCYVTGSVNGAGNQTGGLIGYTDTQATVMNCYSAGTVTGTTQTGGLVGGAVGTVTNSYATGSVTATGSYAGGLIGSAASSAVTNSYATGSVRGNNFVGGLIGQVDKKSGTINLDKIVSSGSVSSHGTLGIGSLIGRITDTADGTSFATINITNASALTSSLDMIGLETMADGTPCASGQMEGWLSNITGLIKPSTTLQIGINGDSSSQITFESSINYDLSALISKGAQDRGAFDVINKFINDLSERATQLGAVSNRLDSALESASVEIENLTSSRSTIRDADIAKESSSYIKSQILQQAAATLLATANQSPSIALQLI